MNNKLKEEFILNFKKGWTLILLTLFAAFSVVATVNAADSNANITFTPAEDTPPVLDPTDPDLPYDPDPEDPTDPQDPPTEESGPLTLDYVSSVNFGEQQIESSTQVYESTTLRPFIQVTDRRGTGEGWNVTAQASGFTSSGNETLPGAVLTFANGTVISTSTSPAPTTTDPVVLNTGGEAANVVTAAEDEGLGSWITRWFPAGAGDTNDSVTLQVPGGSATTGDHTAVITWTLTAGPGQ